MKRIKIIFAILFVVILTAFSTVGALAETVYSIGGYSFSILNNSEIALCGWDNSTPELVVPSEIANKTLVEVYKRGLEGNDGFTTLDFSQADNLNTIGYGSFMNCTGISNELVIPMQVKVIGFSAFENCTSIPSVIINADVSEIQSATFRGCTSLERVESPNRFPQSAHRRLQILLMQSLVAITTPMLMNTPKRKTSPTSSSTACCSATRTGTAM